MLLHPFPRLSFAFSLRGCIDWNAFSSSGVLLSHAALTASSFQVSVVVRGWTYESIEYLQDVHTFANLSPITVREKHIACTRWWSQNNPLDSGSFGRHLQNAESSFDYPWNHSLGVNAEGQVGCLYLSQYLVVVNHAFLHTKRIIPSTPSNRHSRTLESSKEENITLSKAPFPYLSSKYSFSQGFGANGTSYYISQS